MNYETWTAIAGSTIWCKFMLDFALSRHAHGLGQAEAEGLSAMRGGLTQQRLVALFALALLLFNFPLLALWDLEVLLLGLPLVSGGLVHRLGAADRRAGLADGKAGLRARQLTPCWSLGASLCLPAAAVRGGLVGRPPRRRRPLGDRQRLGLCAEHGGVLHGLDLLRQRRPRRFGRGVVPAHLPGPDAGHGAGLDGAAQDDPHRAHLPHHVDRRLRGQPLRQEPAAGRAGDADHGGGHRALHRLAVEGHCQRLCGADHTLGTGRPTGGAGGRTALLYMALALAGFTMVFGTRHLDGTERHEGMVAAIAFESVVKLVAFIAVGVFVTWGLFGGAGDLFARAMAVPELARCCAWPRRASPSPTSSGSR
jgi:hypothetical protein